MSVLIVLGIVFGLALAWFLLQVLWCFDPRALAEISHALDGMRRKGRIVWRRWALCTWRGRHSPVRVPLGWRCATCTMALADLGEAHLGDGYVTATRRLFSRANGGEVTRTSAWSETRRGW